MNRDLVDAAPRAIRACPACGREYTLAQWRQLPSLGASQFDPGEPWLDYVNCTCHSTMTREI